MPLRAIIDEEEVLAPFLSDEEWKALKGRTKATKSEITMICCENKGYLRTSKHGINHFVHKVRSDCDSKPETWQHLKAKAEIAKGCREAGYQAITEASGSNWRADVLAIKGDIKIAFEVQWSSQTLEETELRQERYSDDNVRGCWFFRRPPRKYQANANTPLFKLDVTEDTVNVIFNPYSYEEWYESRNQSMPLAEFTQQLLTGKLRFCDHARSLKKQEINITFFETICYKCKKPYHLYYLSNLKSGCGEDFDTGDIWGKDKFYMSPQIISVVRDFIRSDQRGKRIKLANIGMRYSRTVGDKYQAFSCPHCNSLFGDFFYSEEYYNAIGDPSRVPATLKKEVILLGQLEREFPHWCFPENGIFCC